MKNSKAIREQIGEHLKDIEALAVVAESESRDLSADEQVQVDALVAKIGEQGEKPTGLWAEVARAEKLEKVRASLSPTKAGVAPQATLPRPLRLAASFARSPTRRPLTMLACGSKLRSRRMRTFATTLARSASTRAFLFAMQ